MRSGPTSPRGGRAEGSRRPTRRGSTAARPGEAPEAGRSTGRRGASAAGGTTGRTAAAPGTSRRTPSLRRPERPGRPGRLGRLPARLLGLLAVLVLVPAIVAALLWFAPFLRLSTVEYRTEPDRMAALEAAAPVQKGRPLVEVDTDSVRRAALSDPVFRTASVTRSWPSTLVVEASPRTPVVAVRGPGVDGVRLVSADAVGYETVPDAPEGLLVARADAPDSPEALRSVVGFVAGLDADLLSQARDVRVDAKGRITATIAKVQVAWGTAEDAKLKAAVVRELVGRAGVARVDVSVPMEPVTSRTRSATTEDWSTSGPTSSGDPITPSGEATPGASGTGPGTGEAPGATPSEPTPSRT